MKKTLSFTLAFLFIVSGANAANNTSGTVGTGTSGQAAYYTAPTTTGSTPFITVGTNKITLGTSSFSGAVGIGTTYPLYPIDIEQTSIGTSTGYYVNQYLSGTATGPTSTNLISIGTDSINAGNYFVNGVTIQHYFGSSNMQGGREPLAVYGYMTAPSNASNPNRNYASINGIITAQSADTGTSGAPRGAFFAFGGEAVAQSGATNLLELTGGEFDTASQTGSSVYYKNSISLVGRGDDAVQGTMYDAALAISNGTGAVGWKNGILLGPMNGQQPLASNGCVLCTTGSSTVTKGIDLSSYTFTNSELTLPGPFVVTPSGTLAIGTTTANGGINIYSTADGAAFSWSDATRTGEWLLQEVNSDATNRLRLYGGANGEAISVLTNNNVGIGDTNPGTKLSVTGSAAVTGSIAIGTSSLSGTVNNYSTADGAAVSWSDATAIPRWQLQELTSGSNRLRFYNAPGTLEVMSFLTSGNVGIGETNPAYKLTVKRAASGVAYFGSTGANNAQIVFDNVGAGNYDSFLLNDGGTEKWEFGKDSANDFYAYNFLTSKNFLSDTPAGIVTLGETSGITVLAAGNVGIGSTNPSYKLDVNGAANFSSGIKGVATNTDATAGYIGETPTPLSVASGSGTSLSSGNAANVGSLSLTAGDWNVCGSAGVHPAGTTVVTLHVAWISSTSAALPASPGNGTYTALYNLNDTGVDVSASVGCARFSLSGTTTVYLSTYDSFSVSTATNFGYMWARRMR